MSLTRAPGGGLTRTSDLAFTREDLLSATERLLAKHKQKPDAKAFQDFLEQYRADAFIEDFLVLTLEDAASLAIDLWDFNQEAERLTNRVIRTRRATGADGRALRLDVAEIAGPDMAFLVDSAIGACQEAKVEIRAVLHPIVQGPKGKRSTIQIHLPLMNDAQRADLQKKLEEAFADVALSLIHI